MQNVCCRWMVLVVLALMAAGTAGAAPPQAVHDTARMKVREQLADLLASEGFKKVDVSAASFDQAMKWIYRIVDTYLDRAVPALGGVKVAGEYGVEVLRGLNDHTVHYSDQDGYDLAGDRTLLIANERDAEALGEVVARVAIMIHAAHAGRGVNIRSAARKIFEGMFPVAGTGQSLVSQYLTRLKSMTKAEERELLSFALE